MAFRSAVLLSQLLVCSVIAHADPRGASTTTTPETVVSFDTATFRGTLRPKRVQDLLTGAIVEPSQPGDFRDEPGLIVYDNMYNPLPGSNPERFNLPQYNNDAPICVDALPTGAPYQRRAISTGVMHCEGFSETGRGSVPQWNICSNQKTADAVLDDYQLDSARLLAAGLPSDPNETNLITRHRFLWTYWPQRPLQSPTDIHVLEVAFVDGFDHNQDGRYEVTGGYALTVDWLDPQGAAGEIGIYLFDVDLSGLPGGGIRAANAGFFVMDVRNEAVDSAGNPIPGDFACGTQFEVASGFRFGGDCTPAEMHAVGTDVFDAQWNFFNLENSRRLIDTGDPNSTLCEPLSSLPDGDPSVLSYEDAFTDGLLMPLQFRFTLSNGHQFGWGGNLIATFFVSGSDETTDCPDLDGDGQVTLFELLAVLSAFGIDADGDVDGDGQTGLSDLLMVLSRFGDSC